MNPLNMLKQRWLVTTAIPAASALALITVLAPLAKAGPNDFFGGSIPGTSPPPGVDAAASAADRLGAGGGGGGGGGGGDYTEDEKRMQKKYQANIRHCRDLVAKGDRMIQDGQKRHDDKMFKKGQILKDIGEKRLAEMQANNPFSSSRDGKDKKAAGQ